VYDMICRADTVGVFQIESRAQMSMLPRLRPRCYYDLVIEVAIVRPGPIQGQMVHPYLRRRNGDERVSYPTPEIEEVLRKTLGVPLFQEQAMQLAVVAAGFTPGEADQLRRSMGAWRRSGEIERFRTRLIEGMQRQGLSPEYAERVFEQLRGFGSYGFPESHAASFALLVYVSAWLKRYHPAAYGAALINSQPMGFYAPAQLVRDARDHGVEARPVDVNHSGYDCTLEPVSGDAAGVASDNAWPAVERVAAVEEGSRGNPADISETNGEDAIKEGVPKGRVKVAQRFIAGNDGAHTEKSPVGTNEGSGVAAGGVADSEQQDPARKCRAGLSRPDGAAEDGPVVRKDENGKAAGRPAETGRCEGAFPAPVALRLGMRLVRGVSRAQVAGIERARRDGPFRGVGDLIRRSGASRVTLARLAAADAFRSLGLARREALWAVLGGPDARTEELPLLAGLEQAEPHPSLPEQSLPERIVQDYDTTGLSLAAHPMALVRGRLELLGIVTARRLRGARQGQRVRVAGLVLVRQRPSTAGGTLFFTLEDETGMANLIVRAGVYERFRRAARGSVAVVAEGRVERQGEVIHVQTERITDLSHEVSCLASRSRDFH